MTPDLHGYASDIPYLRDFKPALAPAWLDHVALMAGVEPPVRDDGFAWCDLGCGQGVTASLLAATHPAGVFHGIDAMPMHIDHARRLAAEALVPNVGFHAVNFTAALDLDLPLFDYIVAHGVYTWVDASSQSALRRFIDRRLKPGGLVYISYNAMPGWARDLPFQRLLRSLAPNLAGDCAARVSGAADIICFLADAIPALAGSFIVGELQQRRQDYAPAYLVHEFMPAAWQPLYVTQLRAAMKTIGLRPVGSATFLENLDGSVLDVKGREMLAGIADDDLRELVRDFYRDQRFRCDVFARGNRRLETDERRRRLSTSCFALARPATGIRYMMMIPGGQIAYDDPVTRAIVAALGVGPRSLADIDADADQGQDRLDAMLMLCAAGDAMPVERARAVVASINRTVCQRLGGPEEIHWLALPCGSAIELDAGLMRVLRDGGEINDDSFPGWRSFLAAHGICDQESPASVALVRGAQSADY
jgi:SAM-dependent methyltransferase